MSAIVESAIEFINQNAAWSPYIFFFLLLLAGINIPISEDLMILTGALLAQNNPELIWKIYLGIFLGAYISDLISYALGRFLGDNIWKIKIMAKFVSKDKINKVLHFYTKYGIVTLIVGRFIPFGVRNALFITAGIAKYRPTQFAIADLVACLLTVSCYFALYHTFGDEIIEQVQKANVVIFSIFAMAIFTKLVKMYFNRIKKS